MDRRYILQSKDKLCDDNSTKYMYVWRNQKNGFLRTVEKTYVPKKRRPGRPKQSEVMKEMKHAIRKNMKYLCESDIRELHQLIKTKIVDKNKDGQ